MKHLKLNRKKRLTGVKKLKNELTQIVRACLLDIEWYIIDDILKYLKKQGILYAETPKKNTKKKSSKR